MVRCVVRSPSPLFPPPPSPGCGKMINKSLLKYDKKVANQVQRMLREKDFTQQTQVRSSEGNARHDTVCPQHPFPVPNNPRLPRRLQTTTTTKCCRCHVHSRPPIIQSRP